MDELWTLGLELRANSDNISAMNKSRRAYSEGLALTHSSQLDIRMLLKIFNWSLITCKSRIIDCQELLRPAANLAGRMRGRLEYVNKKMKIIRSRSAERLRGYMRSGAEAVDNEKEWESSPRLRYNNVDNYSNLPVLGQARAIVKSPPNAVSDQDLSFNVGDVIDILQMNPNGLWRGRCGDRVGQFKFVNVEMIARPHGRSSRSRSKSIHEKSIVSIYQVMRIMDLEEYLPVFVLNGYEDMSLFKDLDDQELNYLGIQDVNHRQQLIEMAGFLFPDENKNIKVG